MKKDRGTKNSNRMIKNRDFVVFSDDWGRHPSSCQHLFSHLAKLNRIIWVNTIGTRTPTLSIADFKRALSKIRGWLSSSSEQQIDSPVIVLNPVVIPFDAFRVVRRLNAWLLSRAVQGIIRELELNSVILVTTIPNAAGVVGRVGESLSVYYCVDDFSEWPGADRQSMLEMETDLLSRVNLVVATSERLFRDLSARHSQVDKLPHGVDWEHFQTTDNGEPPDPLSRLPHPRIGYVGLVDERLDCLIIEKLARSLPDWSFVFVGPRQLPGGELDRLSNVHFLDPVDYRDVPATLAELDIAMLPYLKNDLTERINPLKLRELLATGMPIVATSLREIKRYAEYIELADSEQDWKTAILKLAGGTRNESTGQIEAMRSESWESRAYDFSDYLTSAADHQSGVT